MIERYELDCVLLAGRYTLLEQTALDELLPFCEVEGVSILCGGPFNSGVLATGARAGAKTHYDYAPPPADVLARVAQLEAVCDEFSVPLQAAALQFPLGHANEFVAGVVGWADFEDANVADTIHSLAADEKLVGLRPMIQDIADPGWMLDARLAPAYESMIDHDLVFDALVLPRHLPALR